jgi:hypothetical protein
MGKKPDYDPTKEPWDPDKARQVWEGYAKAPEHDAEGQEAPRESLTRPDATVGELWARMNPRTRKLLGLGLLVAALAIFIVPPIYSSFTDPDEPADTSSVTYDSPPSSSDDAYEPPTSSGAQATTGMFADYVRDNVASLADASDSDLIALGEGGCSVLAGAEDVEVAADLAATQSENEGVSLSASDWGTIIGAATNAICPELTHLLN